MKKINGYEVDWEPFARTPQADLYQGVWHANNEKTGKKLRVVSHLFVKDFQVTDTPEGLIERNKHIAYEEILKQIFMT